MSSLVSIRNLTKTYQRGPEKVQVLHGIDLDIPHGDFVALMGPSGSGKTTLLNLIGGLDTPSGGEIEIEGQRIDQLERRPARPMAQPPRRLRVPVLQPDAHADRAEERRTAAAADQAGRRASASATPRSRCSWSAWPTAARTGPTNCPAASSSAWPSPAPSSPTPPS